METNDLAIILVLSAAILHASWNAVIKSGADKLLSLGLIDFTALVICIFLLPFTEFPATTVWVLIAISTLFNTIYRLCMIVAYRIGDFGQVYPVMRGIPPTLVGIFSILFLDDSLGATSLLGIILISMGIILIYFANGPDSVISNKYLGYAIVGGVCIAAYSVIDGLGARESDTAFQYIVHLTIIQSIPIPLIAAAKYKNTCIAYFSDNWRSGLLAGISYLVSYGLVIWAMKIAPIAQATALRESSIIFAGVIGTLFFKEPFGKYRIIAAIMVTIGAILIKGKL